MPARPYEPPLNAPDARPAVIVWYRAYAALIAVWGLVALTGGIMLSVKDDAGIDPRFGFLFAMLGLSAAMFFGIAAFVPYKPWGWTLGFVALAFGMMSCMLPFAIPITLGWIKPATKAAFQRL